MAPGFVLNHEIIFNFTVDPLAHRPLTPPQGRMELIKICCHGNKLDHTAIFKMASRSESQESGVNEDLDAENVAKVDEPVGNLSKYYALPPGYSGTPKKGHLMFDACFESGNLGRVDYITEFEHDLFVRPDTCNPRFRVWFNFSVENTAPYQRVIFNIVNFSKTKSLYREGMTPLVKSTSRPKWQRIPAKNCFYYRCPDHRKNYVLSFAFAFDNDTDVYQFAYCFPYTYSRLQNFLDELDKRNLECYKRELLCLTVQQRRVELLTITSTENMKDDLKKRVIFITARIHPGKPYFQYNILKCTNTCTSGTSCYSNWT